MRRHWVLVTVVVLVLALCGAEPSSERRPAVAALPTAASRPMGACGAPARLARWRAVRMVPPLPEGAALAYAQFPRILTPTETGTIRVVAEVVGDVPSAVFRRNVPTLKTGYTQELWTRSTTRTVDGRLVSVFDQRYPGAILADLLVYAHGYDFPQVPLGRLEVPGSSVTDLDGTPPASTFLTVWLRLASSGLARLDGAGDHTGGGGRAGRAVCEPRREPRGARLRRCAGPERHAGVRARGGCPGVLSAVSPTRITRSRSSRGGPPYRRMRRSTST